MRNGQRRDVFLSGILTFLLFLSLKMAVDIRPTHGKDGSRKKTQFFGEVVDLTVVISTSHGPPICIPKRPGL